MYEAPPPIDPIRCNDPWARNVQERLDVLTEITNLQAMEIRRLRAKIEQTNEAPHGASKETA